MLDASPPLSNLLQMKINLQNDKKMAEKHFSYFFQQTLDFVLNKTETMIQHSWKFGFRIDTWN